MKSVLTDEQKEQLAKMMKSRMMMQCGNMNQGGMMNQDEMIQNQDNN